MRLREHPQHTAASTDATISKRGAAAIDQPVPEDDDELAQFFQQAIKRQKIRRAEAATSSTSKSTIVPSPAPTTSPRYDRAYLIGNRVVDMSHCLWQIQGLIYCKLCGRYADSCMKGLAEICKGFPKKEGIYAHHFKTLQAIERGLPPQKMDRFPLPYDPHNPPGPLT